MEMRLSVMGGIIPHTESKIYTFMPLYSENLNINSHFYIN